jgi:hypothetical protein
MVFASGCPAETILSTVCRNLSFCSFWNKVADLGKDDSLGSAFHEQNKS